MITACLFICVFVCACLSVGLSVFVFICECLCIWARVYLFEYVFVCVYVWLCACPCIFVGVIVCLCAYLPVYVFVFFCVKYYVCVSHPLTAMTGRFSRSFSTNDINVSLVFAFMLNVLAKTDQITVKITYIAEILDAERKMKT